MSRPALLLLKFAVPARVPRVRVIPPATSRMGDAVGANEPPKINEPPETVEPARTMSVPLVESVPSVSVFWREPAVALPT
jgi:hypothetical protein